MVLIRAAIKRVADHRGPRGPEWGPSWLYSEPQHEPKSTPEGVLGPVANPPQPAVLEPVESDPWTEAFDPIEFDCCGGIDAWWDGYDRRHCMNCDPPTAPARRFLRNARNVWRKWHGD